MYKILTLNKISKVGLATLPDTYAVSDDEKNPDGILLRSFKMHDMELPASLKAVARCGAGVNNIPLDKCAEKGIVVFNTPGANANAVKELVLTALLITSRKIIDSYKWAQSLAGTEGVAAAVEKGKSQFVGPEIKGKTLGIIGLGAIGALVANAAVALGMKVIGYDPFLSLNGALRIDPSVKYTSNLDDIFAASDYITVHVPLTDDTRNVICKETLKKCKNGVRIINLARGELVNTSDIKDAIADGKVSFYVTDFPNEEAVGAEGIITLPHIGASTPEAEDNCAVMAAGEIQDYLENGNIVNSVNFPSVTLNATGTKICVLHKNVEDITTKVISKLSNVNASVNKTRGNYGYAVFDAASADDGVKAEIEKIDGVIAVRIIG